MGQKPGPIHAGVVDRWAVGAASRHHAMVVLKEGALSKQACKAQAVMHIHDCEGKGLPTLV